ncbi:MAG: hypothetical protein NZM04_03445 [Methylacidiphilales bacterium]|nr:hypothetical protein [Candidatus Methylacidiphilales bacterium]MDW8350234.1 hypothetical protein [Verrucomicrobiae bacterium]
MPNSHSSTHTTICDYFCANFTLPHHQERNHHQQTHHFSSRRQHRPSSNQSPTRLDPLSIQKYQNILYTQSFRFYQSPVESSAGRENRNKSRDHYMDELIRGLIRPPNLPTFTSQAPHTLPSPRWLALQINFTLTTPWFSKDDRVFHVLDNPIRRDRLFALPFMSAAAWKGLLRWTYQHLLSSQSPANPPPHQTSTWITHLFGHSKAESEEFTQGALHFYPTWFSRVSFECINPHSRATRAGRLPIIYEVVPPDHNGIFRLLYAPRPLPPDKLPPHQAIEHLLLAIEKLLTTYGFSAKRTAGWGTAEITKSYAFFTSADKSNHKLEDQSPTSLIEKLKQSSHPIFNQK